MTRPSSVEFPKAVKLAAWQRSGGKCECGCGVKIIAGDGPQYDHVLEATLGGEPTLENCRMDEHARRRRSRDEWPKFYIRKKHDDEVPALSLRSGPGEGQAPQPRPVAPLLRSSESDEAPLA